MMYMDMEGRLDSLLGGTMDLRKRLRVTKRERDYARKRAKLIKENINKAEGMVREAREK